MKRILDKQIDSTTIIAVFLSILTFMNLNIPNYNIVKLISICIVALYIVLRYRTYIFLKYKFLNIILILFSILVMYSAFINRSMLQRDPVFAAIGYIGTFVEGFLFFQIVKENNEEKKVYKVIFNTFLIFTIIVDLLLFMPGKGYYNGGYLIGTKFSISYIHIFLFTMYLLNYSHKVYRGIIIPLIGIIASFIVNCSTGLFANTLLIILFLVFHFFKKRKFSFIVFLIVIWMSYMFIYWYSEILKIELFQKIVVEYLERDLTLSSRVNIYRKLPKLLHKVWNFGYGYGSAYEIGSYYGFPNSQNGVADWIWSFGIYGTVTLIITLAYIIFKVKINNDNKVLVVALMSAIYIFIIIATVEISLGQSFLGLFVILFSLGDYNGKNSFKLS